MSGLDGTAVERRDGQIDEAAGSATGGDGRIRDDGSWTGGRRLPNGRICDGRGLCDGRTAGSAAGGDEDDGADERRRGGRRG